MRCRPDSAPVPAGRGKLKGLKRKLKILSKGSSMDISQLTSTTASSSGVQGMGGHHHHHKSISDQISDMESAINGAVQAGKLTSDQASTITKELDDIKQMLSQASTSSTTSTTSTATQLSSDDRQKIREELRDIGKQLFSALNPQQANSSSSTSPLDAIFKAMDTNGDGSISKDELTSFFSNLAANGAGASSANNLGLTYGGQATISMTEMQSTFSVTA
jgi:Ca2+-binding EF-hand superfamily protein